MQWYWRPSSLESERRTSIFASCSLRRSIEPLLLIFGKTHFSWEMRSAAGMERRKGWFVLWMTGTKGGRMGECGSNFGIKAPARPQISSEIFLGFARWQPRIVGTRNHNDRHKDDRCRLSRTGPHGSDISIISKDRRWRTWVRSREEDLMFCIENFDNNTSYVDGVPTFCCYRWRVRQLSKAAWLCEVVVETCIRGETLLVEEYRSRYRYAL